MTKKIDFWNQLTIFSGGMEWFPAPGRPEAQPQAQRADGSGLWGKSGALQVVAQALVVGRWAEVRALQVAGRWVELRAQQVVAQACYTPMASDSTRAGRERIAPVAGRRRAGQAWQAPLGWRGQLGLRRQYLKGMLDVSHLWIDTKT